jgi:hypothetical protein
LDINAIPPGGRGSFILLWNIPCLGIYGPFYINSFISIVAGINKTLKMKTITIYLNDPDDNIKTWMIKETKFRISNRYKQIHVAEDIGVNTTQLWRFMNDSKVSEDFYIKWFKWYSKIS